VRIVVAVAIGVTEIELVDSQHDAGTVARMGGTRRRWARVVSRWLAAGRAVVAAARRQHQRARDGHRDEPNHVETSVREHQAAYIVPPHRKPQVAGANARASRSFRRPVEAPGWRRRTKWIWANPRRGTTSIRFPSVSVRRTGSRRYAEPCGGE